MFAAINWHSFLFLLFGLGLAKCGLKLFELLAHFVLTTSQIPQAIQCLKRGS